MDFKRLLRMRHKIVYRTFSIRQIVFEICMFVLALSMQNVFF
jgi:hypothetical protein